MGKRRVHYRYFERLETKLFYKLVEAHSIKNNHWCYGGYAQDGNGYITAYSKFKLNNTIRVRRIRNNQWFGWWFLIEDEETMDYWCEQEDTVIAKLSKGKKTTK